MNEERIIKSWHSNASPWISAVREQQIESRRTITDRAILEAMLSAGPASVLDIGCGEGWLARALGQHGVEVTGIDVVPGLINAARSAGGGDFQVVAYEQLATHPFTTRFDALVCNFSLIGKSSTEHVFAAASGLLRASGKLFVQTLHPIVACGDAPYQDGWREGSWAGFSEAFRDPAPWYFRTLESWVALVRRHGLQLEAIKEPVRSAGSQPASIILVISNQAPTA